jgi:phosphohistidine phosphatase SixA
MIRDLILLRHAHAQNASPGQDDAQRELSARGMAEAAAAGVWLAAHQVLPARVLCSPAQRTRQTLDTALHGSEAILEPRIYAATAGQLVALIEEFADAPRLLLVGHNPGFETLVALLTTGQSGDFRGMPPAAIAWIELDGAIDPGAGKLKAFWAP